MYYRALHPPSTPRHSCSPPWRSVHCTTDNFYLTWRIVPRYHSTSVRPGKTAFLMYSRIYQCWPLLCPCSGFPANGARATRQQQNATQASVQMETRRRKPVVIAERKRSLVLTEDGTLAFAKTKGNVRLGQCHLLAVRSVLAVAVFPK